MTEIAGRNRLDAEESPYLLAHADNPVHWQPWDERALAEARERDVPIFLSSGYAACHWCHVMAGESFEDEAVAEVLNEGFVPVKIDREERPDVDRIYQTICQQVSGRGGWPLSVWLTPDQKPFYVGTYFPKEPRRGMPGFLELLEDIASSWSDADEREELEKRAEQWTAAVEGELESVPDQPHQPAEETVERAAKAAVRAADRTHGGWGSGPKFPQTGRVHLLLRAYERTDRDVYREVVTETLDAMAEGGMYDHVGGGFHRYAVDGEWTVPHFEKMLYDNAELPRAYLAGYQVTGEERYAEVVRETLGFVERELTHDDGGFFSTLDAQSERAGEREEGAYYIWTPEQVREAVDDEHDATLFCERYGITERGNFEGKTVLTLAHSVDALAERHEMEPEAVEEALERAREQVFEAREERPRPPRDEKVLASWNGLMIAAFSNAAIVLDEEHATPATEALAFVREQLWDPDAERLTRRYKDGVAKVDGYLDDYAFLARGAFELYQATREREHLGFAMALAEAIEREFYDEEVGTLYYTPAAGESLITRPQELVDQSTPSSLGVAVELFDQLDHFRTDDAFGELAESVIETHGSRVRANPLSHASLALAADTVRYGTLEVALLVDDELPESWRDEFARQYLGSRVLAWRPGDDDAFETWLDELGLESEPPIWADREQRSDRPTVYVCRSRTCSPPRSELSTALAWARRMT